MTPDVLEELSDVCCSLPVRAAPPGLPSDPQGPLHGPAAPDEPALQRAQPAQASPRQQRGHGQPGGRRQKGQEGLRGLLSLLSVLKLVDERRITSVKCVVTRFLSSAPSVIGYCLLSFHELFY